MAMMSIPLGKNPYASPYISVGKEICQNLYLEIAQSENSKAQYYFLKIPGMKLISLKFFQMARRVGDPAS